MAAPGFGLQTTRMPHALLRFLSIAHPDSLSDTATDACVPVCASYALFVYGFSFVSARYVCVLVRVSFSKRHCRYLLLLRGLASKQSVFGTLLAVKAYMELDLQRRYRLYILDAAYSERAFT